MNSMEIDGGMTSKNGEGENEKMDDNEMKNCKDNINNNHNNNHDRETLSTFNELNDRTNISHADCNSSNFPDKTKIEQNNSSIKLKEESYNNPQSFDDDSLKTHNNDNEPPSTITDGNFIQKFPQNNFDNNGTIVPKADAFNFPPSTTGIFCVPQSRATYMMMAQMHRMPPKVPPSANCYDDPAMQFRHIFHHARYFIIKSINHENVQIAKEKNVWATFPKNESILNKAFSSNKNVLLLFSVQESRMFQGFARIAERSRRDLSPIPWVLPSKLNPEVLRGTFKLDWITKESLSFSVAQSLRNGYNDGKEVKIGRDGTEIDPKTGEQLCRLFPSDGSINLRPIVEKAIERENSIVKDHQETNERRHGHGRYSSDSSPDHHHHRSHHKHHDFHDHRYYTHGRYEKKESGHSRRSKHSRHKRNSEANHISEEMIKRKLTGQCDITQFDTYEEYVQHFNNKRITDITESRMKTDENNFKHSSDSGSRSKSRSMSPDNMRYDDNPSRMHRISVYDRIGPNNIDKHERPYHHRERQRNYDRYRQRYR
ncbi:hypothetical protein SNEBB_005056 [Seison nebaliae]|nr:hypothetical protein SNEBB_005056 [Seison nebaliae]